MDSGKVVNNFEVYADSVRHEMLPFIPANARTILDVGCSVGNFGELLKQELRAEVWGVESDEQAAEIASHKLDRVFPALFDRNLNLPVGKFDCIVFNDVLEHMIDPYGALEYARGLLSKSGCVVASIPNVRYFGNIWTLLVHKNWEYVDAGILDRTHLRFFTERTIRSTFEDLGYRVETLAGINPLEKYDSGLVSRFKLLNLLLLNNIRDMEFLQFAVVARSGE